MSDDDHAATPIPCQRERFDIPDDIAYLNCAYMSPLLRHAAEAGAQAMWRKARPWEITSVEFFTDSERARALFGRLIGAPGEDVAIIPAASYGIAVAAANLELPAGRPVLLLADQFPSNVYPWRELARQNGAEVLTVTRRPDDDWTHAVLELLDERVAIAALPHCRWTDGGLLDLEAIGRRCREVGAALVVDATQSLGALPLDVRAVDPDFLVCPGYKWLLGPYSLGYMYVAPRRHEGRPLEHNWIGRAGSEDFARLVDYQEAFQPGARRYDMGERSNFALLPASIAALEQLLAWGVGNIAATLADMTARIAGRAADLGLRSVDPGLRAGHFLGLRFPEGIPPGLPERLAEERVYVSLRGDSLRVTPHLYNDERDLERLFAVLRATL